ncbi:hypothetical protein ACXQDA_03985 [Staphylococcus argenteus]|uniref:hypothetical protein n=1 Tax=Staphylococcus argenteus TaxID=985002 RepID=UPI001F48B8F2|nr:hypothetical protein [Staphylococcus argenteus]
MNLTVKVNVDADEAIEKLERIKKLYKEINELQNRQSNANVTVTNDADTQMIESFIDEENAENSEYNVVVSYSPDTSFIEVEGDVDYNIFKDYKRDNKKMIITFKQTSF